MTTTNIYAGGKKLVMAIITLTGWFGLILQLVVMLHGEDSISTSMKLINFISYFTLLTNFLVTLTLTMALLGNGNGFFDRTSVQSAAAVYITTVGVTYFFLLKDVWNPQGWQKVADVTLHYVMPIIYFFYWIFFVPKQGLKWGNAITWVFFPLVYLLYSLARGSVTGWYAYPFIDVSKLGMQQVLINSGGMTAGFLVLSLLFIAFGRVKLKLNGEQRAGPKILSLFLYI